MKRMSLAALILPTMLIVSCKYQSPVQPAPAAIPMHEEDRMDDVPMNDAMKDDAMRNEQPRMEETSDMIKPEGAVKEVHYGDYSMYGDGVIGNGSESVLFFHAAWCPYCIANNERLQTWYAEQRFPRSTYKVDYDTETELKQRYNVTNQDTFILIDGNGTEIKRMTFPSESALREILG